MQIQLEAWSAGPPRWLLRREGAERHSPINDIRRQAQRSVPQPLNPARARALGLAATDISVPPVVASTGTPHLLIGVKTMAAVERAKPAAYGGKKLRR